MNVGPYSGRRFYRGIGSSRHRARFRRKVLRHVVGYELPSDFLPSRRRRVTPSALLLRLGIEFGESAETALAAALRGFSAGLPRAEVCPVVSPDLSRGTTIREPLAVLAVIAQSSESVWLRSREPRLERIETPRAVALWVPGGLRP